MTATKISYATCPLCEATCGLEIESRDSEIISIRGDAQDVFSHGYICPKAYSLKELHADPDCIREPLVRKDDKWINVSWDDAFAEIERGLMPILDEHGHDSHFLFALVHTLFAEGLVAPGKLAEHIAGLEQVRLLAEPFTPERVATTCGIDASMIRAIARALAAAPRAAVYGRIGTCTQEFGTLSSWLVDVLNVLTGNLDREGGAMFPKAAAGSRNTTGTHTHGRGVRFGRWKSRVRGLPEIYGELPASCLAEEIDTPGEGQVKALITLAGNPALSTPNSHRLQRALDSLQFMVSIDIYLNETTRYANVILPPPPVLARSHYDLAFYQLAVHNVANYSAPVIEREAESLDEWELFLRLTGILAGQGPEADPSSVIAHAIW